MYLIIHIQIKMQGNTEKMQKIAKKKARVMRAFVPFPDFSFHHLLSEKLEENGGGGLANWTSGPDVEVRGDLNGQPRIFRSEESRF